MFNVIFIPCAIYYSRLSSTSHATLRMETYTGFVIPFGWLCCFYILFSNLCSIFGCRPEGGGCYLFRDHHKTSIGHL